MGILVNTGFDVGSSNPIDSRTVKNTTDERDELVTDGLVYENLKVYCKDTQTEYRWTGTEWEEVGSGGTVDLSEYTKTYTSLSQLGLTAPITVGEIFNAMPDKTTAMIGCEDIADHITDVPMSYGILIIEKKNNSRFSIEYQNSLGGNATNVKRWIGTLKGLDGTGLYWQQIITENSKTDPYSCSGYTELTGTEDLFTLPCGHYFSEKANTTYNYPLTDSDKVTAHIYVLGNLNIPSNNQGYRIILYFDNKGRTYNANEWWGVFGSWNRLDNDTRVTTLETQVSELFQSVSSGKTLVANAITGKGVSTSTTATFATMATNISKIGGSKEETKSYNNTSAGITPITLTFSANVLGIKQVIPPSDMAYITPQTSANMFRIEGKSITIYVTGSGTWKVTALIKA